MSGGKRGGARPSAGRKRIFTDSQEWLIGVAIHDHIVRSAHRHHTKKVEQLVFADNNLRGQFKVLKAAQAKRKVGGKVTDRVSKRALEERTADIAADIEIALSGGGVPTARKVPDGIRKNAILAMARLLRRQGYSVSADTVRHIFDRHDANKARAFENV